MCVVAIFFIYTTTIVSDSPSIHRKVETFLSKGRNFSFYFWKLSTWPWQNWKLFFPIFFENSPHVSLKVDEKVAGKFSWKFWTLPHWRMGGCKQISKIMLMWLMMCALPFLNHSFGKILEVGRNWRQRKPLPDWGCLRWAMWSNCAKLLPIFVQISITYVVSIVLTFSNSLFCTGFLHDSATGQHALWDENIRCPHLALASHALCSAHRG